MNNIQKIILVVILMVTSFSVGLTYQERKNKDSDFVTNNNLFSEIQSILDEKFYGEKPSSKELVEASIEGYVSGYGDDYTHFFSTESTEFFNEEAAGEFAGAGMEIAINSGFLTVIAPLKNSPAETAGVLSGDVVLEVDGIDIGGMNLEEAISKIRGEKGSELILNVYRPSIDDQLELKLVRDIVQIPTLSTSRKGNTFIIELYSFNEKSSELFEGAINEFADSDSTNLLLDLRDNPGGFLDSAVDISSYFLEQGALVVQENFGERSKKSDEKYRSKGHKNISEKDYEMIVLQNIGSASASEILSGALRDHKKAKIVGDRSYGKGSVQEYIELEGGNAVKLTIAKWLTPEGLQIDETGIEPDIKIEAPKEQEIGSDRVLEEALTLFKK